jgi:hypothetical protein
MMRAAIGGELVKWNATHIGMNYMFLDSMHHQWDKFMTWMASPSFLERHFTNMNEGRFTHSCLSSLIWWETMHFVLREVEPLYSFLHFADQDNVPNLSEVLLRFSMVESEYESLLQAYPTDLRRYLDVIHPRVCAIQSHMYVNAGNTNCGSF